MAKIQTKLLSSINNLYDLGLTTTQIHSLENKLLSLVGASVVSDYTYSYLSYVIKTDQFQFKSDVNGAQSGYIYIINKNTNDSEYNFNEVEISALLSLKSNEYFQLEQTTNEAGIFIKDIQITDLQMLETFGSFLKGLDNNIFENCKNEFDNFREFYDYYRQFCFDNYNKINEESRYNDSLLIKAAESLCYFSNVKHTQEKITKHIKDNLLKHENLWFITDVYQINNFRIFISTSRSNYGYENDSLRILPYNSPHYNYIDAGRYYIGDNRDDYDSSTECAQVNDDLGDYIFTDLDVIFPTHSVMQDIFKKKKLSKGLLLSKADLTYEVKKHSAKVANQKSDDENKKILAKKIQLKVKSLLDKDAYFKLNDVEYYNNKIVYQNQILEIDNYKNWVHSVFEMVLKSYEYHNINFDFIFDTFLNCVFRINDKHISGTIGDIKFVYDVNVKANQAGIEVETHKINDIRINAVDIKSCLENALYHTSTENYNDYLDTVSHCSLKMHHYLNNGITTTARDIFERRSIAKNLTFKLKRYKNLNFLVSGNNEYQISNSNSFVKIQGKTELIEILNILLDSKIVKDIDSNNIKQIIKQAELDYQEHEKLKYKVIADTEKLFNLKLERINLDNDISISEGYIIKGKLRTYCIDKRGKNNVYSYPEGRYLCMIDKSNTQEGIDKLVSKIYALHNDNLVVNTVPTLLD